MIRGSSRLSVFEIKNLCFLLQQYLLFTYAAFFGICAGKHVIMYTSACQSLPRRKASTRLFSEKVGCKRRPPQKDGMSTTKALPYSRAAHENSTKQYFNAFSKRFLPLTAFCLHHPGVFPTTVLSALFCGAEYDAARFICYLDGN